MAYVLSTKVDPLAVKVIFADCCTGIEFYKSIITLKGLGICCGVSLDAELSFLKEKGFRLSQALRHRDPALLWRLPDGDRNVHGGCEDR
jgi:hypothetical protein